MIYDLSDSYSAKQAKAYFDSLLKAGADIELKKRQQPKTVSQNAYLHVAFSILAISLGYSLDEIKTLIKRQIDFMIYEKNNTKFLRSVATLDKTEIGNLIDRVRAFGVEQGIYIPTPEEYLQSKTTIDIEIESNKRFL